MTFTVTALAGIPEIKPGDDLGTLLAQEDIGDGDVVVVAQKIVSKAEGRLRELSDVEPSARAREIAVEQGKDARLVQVVLDESAEVLRAERGVLICETRHGYVCANAGVDLSNAPGGEVAVLLPEDPDGSARRLRAATGKRVGIVISDSFGRAWRVGQADVAIGAAGVVALDDWRGREDAGGRELLATEIAIADQLASAADLARRKDSREPVVVIRGAAEFVTDEDGPGAAALRRARAMDLFR